MLTGDEEDKDMNEEGSVDNTAAMFSWYSKIINKTLILRCAVGIRYPPKKTTNIVQLKTLIRLSLRYLEDFFAIFGSISYGMIIIK